VAYADPEPSSYIPVVKGNPDLVGAIDSAIDKLRENGELKAVSEKYFNGVDVTRKE
jgi:ABC-type amino acid transport substrate-binding protein